MTPRKYFTVQQAGREADLHLFGDIVDVQYMAQDTSAHSLSQQINTLDADVINVYIDSRGGSVPEGWAIYNQLRQHPARVRTYGVGFVASAALYPFLAGDERYAVEPSAYFLHQVIVEAGGYADDLRSAADVADQMTEIGLAPFVQAGIDPDAVREMMKNETWLSPQGALDFGIATSILTGRPDPGIHQSAMPIIMQKLLTPAPPETPEPAPKPHSIMQMLGGMIKMKE